MKNSDVRHLDNIHSQIFGAIRFLSLIAFFLLVVPFLLFLFRKALNKKIS